FLASSHFSWDCFCCCPGCWRAVSPIRREYWETWAGMPPNLWISLGELVGFLLVLPRVGGALVFVPLPGFRGGADIAPPRGCLGFELGAVCALARGRCCIP